MDETKRNVGILLAVECLPFPGYRTSFLSLFSPFSLLPVVSCKNRMTSFCCLRDFLTKSVEVSYVLNLVSCFVVLGEPQKVQIADVDQISTEVIYTN